MKKYFLIFLFIILIILNVGVVFATDDSLDSAVYLSDFDSAVSLSDFDSLGEGDSAVSLSDSDSLNSDNSLDNNGTYKTNSTINIVSSSVIYYNGEFEVNLTDSNTGEAISNGNITFNIENQSFIRTTNDSGFCSIIMDLSAGNYSINYEFLGDDLYYPYNGSTNITVLKNQLSLTNASDIVYCGSNFSVCLKDSFGNPVSNQVVDIIINTRSYPRITNNEGFANLQINLIPKNYTIAYRFNETDFYESCNGSNILTVCKSSTKINNISDFVYRGEDFRVYLKDTRGNPVSNHYVKFTVNTRTYYSLTDSDGIAKLRINLNPKFYIISYGFDGNLLYDGAYASSNLCVSRRNTSLLANNTIMYHKDGTKFCVSLKDGDNNSLTNQTVVITINGRSYNRITNNEGIASLDINLNIGNYSVSYKFNENQHYSSSNGTAYVLVNGTQLFAYDTVINYGKGEYFEITAKSYDKSYLPYKNIVFTINGRSYNISSNDKGIAKLQINLRAGLYNINCSCLDDDNKTISVSRTISVILTSGRLGENHLGYVDLIGVLGNPFSTTKIAYTIGVHSLERQVHNALYDLLPNANLNYCYYIYKVTVTNNPYDYSIGRMNGQLLAREFIVPHILWNNYDLVVDVHSNTGYPINYFLYGALNENKSVNVAYQIINKLPGFEYYFPESQTSPPYLINNFVNAGIKAICFESWGYESVSKTYNCVSKLISAVDQANVKF